MSTTKAERKEKYQLLLNSQPVSQLSPEFGAEPVFKEEQLIT